MPELSVYIASHYFKVDKITPRGRTVVNSFAKRFVQYGFQRNNNRYIHTALKVFAMSTADRSEYRFHINVLKQFEEHLIANYLTGDMVEFIKLDVPIPVEVELKILPHWVPRDYQLPVIDYLTSDELPISKFVNLQTGKGKEQPLYAKIKIPGGWSTMGEMHVGTKVIAKDGSVTEVTAVHPQGKKQLYKITFADGRSTECGADHLWKVYYTDKIARKHCKVINTIEIIRLITVSKLEVYIDLIDPENNQDSILPIDPYVLGVILGNNNILQDSKENNDYLKNEYNQKIKELGLYGKLNHEEFIPEQYLNASYTQKLSLLQGLIDTNGYFYASDANIEYFTTSEQLAKDVQYLVRSIGGIAEILSKIPCFRLEESNVVCRINYRIKIKVKDPSILFRLPIKKERANGNNQYSYSLKLKIISIFSTTIEECQCITIAHPDHLYVTDDFIVTHNSFVAMVAMAKRGYRVGIIVKPMYIEKWIMDLRRTYELNSEDIMVIRGSDQLMALLLLAKDGELRSKIVIISNKTFQNWIKLYERFKYEILDMGYACLPDNVFELLGIGVRLIDEVHQDFHLNFKIDLLTNVKHSISLSATLVSDDDFINRMYEIAYPATLRYRGLAYDKYIAATAVIYRIRDIDKIRYRDNVTKTYSHNLFEQSILRNKSMMNNYMELINATLKGSYLLNYKKGQKCIIFCSSIDMCTTVTSFLRNIYKNHDVRRYVEQDLFENLIDADIIVSTLMSAGTAVDIDNLTTVILTIAISSSQSNIQGMGRLRKLKDDTTPMFLYFVCEDIPKHLEYHEKKRAILESRALTYKSVHIGNPI